jgi:hypothetical protein
LACLASNVLNCSSAKPCCNPTDFCSTPPGQPSGVIQCNKCIGDNGTGCTKASECCSGVCGAGGTCQPATCTEAGGLCNTNPNACCPGLTCKKLQDSYCTPNNCMAVGLPCQNNAECCSNSCTCNACDP